MNEPLNEKFKEFHTLQKQIDYLNAKQEVTKHEIEQLILKQRLVGKKFKVGKWNICYKKTETTQGFSQKYIAQCLEEFFGEEDPEVAEAFLGYCLDNRVKKSKYSLEVRKKQDGKR